MYARSGKRLVDMVIGVVLFCAALPILAVSALAIAVDSKGPLLFRHRRVGQNGKCFDVLKLRTMYYSPEACGANLTTKNDKRITRVGRWLRKTKIDELPQLLNVLRGEMSLVGPRPEAPEYVAHYQEKDRSLLTLRPGITSLASLAFINEEQFLTNESNADYIYLSSVLPQKLAIEQQYLQEVRLWTDLTILTQTLLHIGGLFRIESSALLHKRS